MENCVSIQIYRLNRCLERLQEEYKFNAPDIIKRVELLLIQEICDNLLINLKGE